MNETCDRCGPDVRAHYELTKAQAHDGRLTLCSACSYHMWRDLVRRGWLFTSLGYASAPQQVA